MKSIAVKLTQKVHALPNAAEAALAKRFAQ
jgi:hypothetical protein